MLGVLRSKDKVVGIVQLVNKNVEDDGISFQDETLIQSILPVLAAGICNAHDFNVVWEISLSLRGCMKSILKLVKEESLVILRLKVDLESREQE